MYTSLTIADPLFLRLIQECLSLENRLGCHGATDLVLKTDNNSQGLQGIKKLVFESDWKACLSEASQHPLLPKLPLISPGPNCGTWVWIMAHWAQLHYRLCIPLSPSVLTRPFGVVHTTGFVWYTTWLVPGNTFAPLGLKSNYDIHSATRLISN